MPQEVASLFATLKLRDDQFKAGLNDARSDLRSARGDLSGLSMAARNTGGAMTVGLTTPIMAAGGAAIVMGRNFDESMANARSILGVTRSESASLTNEILNMGARSRQGPQAVADAYYQIVSGVQDADAHMSILNASIRTAEAGNADLTATTTGMVNIMNAYGLGAEEAAFVSDVLSQTVGMGVGNMEQFTGALGPAAGLAFDLGIGIEELAANTAFLTMMGSSASEATTQLTAVMTAFLKPNTAMTEALKGMGYESGAAAIEALGLQGAVSALYGEVGSTDAMAQALGSTEALGGAMGLNTERAAAFEETFVGSMDGVTESMRDIQMEGFTAQFDLFMASVGTAGIAIGMVLLPPLTELITTMTPVIVAFAMANPEIIKTAIAIAGMIAVVGPLTMALGVLLSPVGLLILAIAGIMYAANELYPGGIVALFKDASTTAQQLAFIGLHALNNAAIGAKAMVDALVGSIQWMIDKAKEGIEQLSQLNNAGAMGAMGSLASGGVTPGGVLGGPVWRAASSLFGGGRADGGPVDGGTTYLVGEEGPELFVPGSSGSIVPNDAMGMGNVTINLNVTEGNARAAGTAFADSFAERWRASQ